MKLLIYLQIKLKKKRAHTQGMNDGSFVGPRQSAWPASINKIRSLTFFGKTKYKIIILKCELLIFIYIKHSTGCFGPSRR